MEIQKFENFNIDGICKVRFALLEEVSQISFPDDEHTVTITLVGGKQMIEMYFTRQKEDLKINEVQDDSGTWFQIDLALINPSLDPSKAVTFKSLRNKDLIFVITDNNGRDMLIGSIDKPARITSKLSIPGSGMNQRGVNVRANSDFEPYFVADEILISGGALSNGFSNGFSI